MNRIRDNQRRSRSRRKQYLEELEARLRRCGAQGIEVFPEILHAARKAADENKKLRALLSEHGVRYGSIEAYLHSDILGGPIEHSRGFLQDADALQPIPTTHHITSSPRQWTYDMTGTDCREPTGSSDQVCSAPGRNSPRGVCMPGGWKLLQGYELADPSSIANVPSSGGVSRSHNMLLEPQRSQPHPHINSFPTETSTVINTTSLSGPRDPLETPHVYDLED